MRQNFVPVCVLSVSFEQSAGLSLAIGRVLKGDCRTLEAVLLFVW